MPSIFLNVKRFSFFPFFDFPRREKIDNLFFQFGANNVEFKRVVYDRKRNFPNNLTANVKI